MSQIYKIIYNSPMNHAIKNSCELLGWKFGDILEVKDEWIEKVSSEEPKERKCGCNIFDTLMDSMINPNVTACGTTYGDYFSNNLTKPKSKMELEAERIESKSNQIAKDHQVNQNEKEQILAKDKILDYIKNLKNDDKYLQDITENYQLAKTIKQNIDISLIESFMILIRKFVEDNS